LYERPRLAPVDGAGLPVGFGTAAEDAGVGVMPEAEDAGLEVIPEAEDAGVEGMPKAGDAGLEVKPGAEGHRDVRSVISPQKPASCGTEVEYWKNAAANTLKTMPLNILERGAVDFCDC